MGGLLRVMRQAFPSPQKLHFATVVLRTSTFHPILLKPTPSSCGIIRRASSEEQFSPVRCSTREANELYPPRFVVNLRCRLLSLLRIHSPNCEVCNAREEYGLGMRRRLEELNWRRQPHSLNHGDHGEVGSEPSEVITTPISWKAQKKKTA